MSGLNVLLWTIAIILILGAAMTITFFVYAFIVRKKEMKNYQDNHSLRDALEDAKAKREELLKQQGLN